MIELYNLLLKEYGHQGWWPIQNKYHPKDYSFPKNDLQKFEICVGAILTQNTSWNNIEKAIDNLRNINALNPKKLNVLDIEKLKQAIRPAGYFNQKAKKIKIFTEFYLKLKGTPTRKQLLSLWGIGPETADSILLYAYNVSTFVIDAYTKKILIKLNLIKENCSYDDMKELFEKNIPKDYKIYQEFHALIVQHGKKST